MKKKLLSSSIALASLCAGSAATAVPVVNGTSEAGEWQLDVGGYMTAHVGYASVDAEGDDTDFDGIDTKIDAEIQFKPSITLDNGLKIGANIELEGNTNGDQIDESFLFIKGSFGEVLLGSENSAGYLMHYGAPNVSLLDGDNQESIAVLGEYIPFSGSAGGDNRGDDFFRGTLGTTYLENDRNNDAQRITYFSPKFAGFQIGVSYARDGNQDNNGQADCSGDSFSSTCDYFDIAANYVNSFGGFDINASLRWGQANNKGADSSDPEVWGTGINVGFSDFTVGASYAEQDDAAEDNGEAYDLGVSYKTGPWQFSFTYFNGENVDDEDSIASGGNGSDEEFESFLLVANYQLAKGIHLSAFAAQVDFDEQQGDPFGSTNADGDDMDGFVIGTGIQIRF